MFKPSVNFISLSPKLNLLSLLQKCWDEIHSKQNIFRYKIINLEEKSVDGYLLQLNPNRNSKRRTPEEIYSVCQPFNENKFNFTKISRDEILFGLNDGHNDAVHIIIVNISPISLYHSLLCPSVNKCLPQVVTIDSLELAIKLTFVSNNRAFRIGFNSLCALASVNHLHYHIFVEENILPVETATCHHLSGPVYCTSEYPIPAFCFQASSQELSSKLANDVYTLLEYFSKNSIAHNLFITYGRDFNLEHQRVLRILVWPRKSCVGVKQLGAFNVAVCELSGWFPVYNASDFKNLHRDALENELKKWRIDTFEHLYDKIKLLYEL
ncbi:hypothetical protein ACJJTC_010388 [Scirpophaga incertulas]